MSDWIKVEKDLANDPRVLRMASRLRHADVTLGSRSRLVIVGALITLWWYADTHIRDDDTLPIGADQINELVGVDGFCELMPQDWLQVIDSNSVKLVDYLVHNGSSAKTRALGQKRQENHRKNTRKSSRSRNAVVTQSALPDKIRLDKNKEEDKNKSAAAPRVVPTKSAKSNSKDFDPASVPNLCAESWQKWLAYRAERKPAIRSASMQAAAEELAAFGEQQSVVVKHSMANGYQGLFAPKANGQHQRAPPMKLKTADEIEAEERARGDWDAQH